MNLLNQPEFRDIEKVRVLFEMLEQDNLMNEVLRSHKVGLQVRIGQENEHKAFRRYPCR